MSKTAAVIRYEYKMLLKNPAGWCLLILVTALALFDNFPSEANLARLEFLNEPAYFISRTLRFDGLLMVFGLMFLLSGRFSEDERTNMRALLMASPLDRKQYAAGKLLGGFLYAFTMLGAFLTTGTAVYALAAPFPVSFGECVYLAWKTIAVSALPAAFFVGCGAAAVPLFLNLRMFYLLAAALLYINASYVGGAYSAPFWLITSGDLLRLIWVHPKWPFDDMGSVWANLMFLLGTGALFFILALTKRGDWREE